MSVAPSEGRVREVYVNQVHDPARGMFTIKLVPYTVNGPVFFKGIPVYIDAYGKRYAVHPEGA